MEKTLSAILSEIRNYFDDNTEHLHGAFTIENGKFTDTDFLAVIKENQYFRTWIMKNGERIGEIKLLPLLCFYDPIQYVDSYLQEVEKREKEIK